MLNPFWQISHVLKAGSKTPQNISYFSFSYRAVKNVQTPVNQAPGNFSCWKGSQIRIRSNLQAAPGWDHIPDRQALPSFNPCTQFQNICRGQKQALPFKTLLHSASDQHTTAWNSSQSWLTRKINFLKKPFIKAHAFVRLFLVAHLPGLLFMKTKANIKLAGIPPSLYLSKSSAMFLI